MSLDNKQSEQLKHDVEQLAEGAFSLFKLKFKTFTDLLCTKSSDDSNRPNAEEIKKVIDYRNSLDNAIEQKDARGTYELLFEIDIYIRSLDLFIEKLSNIPPSESGSTKAKT